MAKFDPQPTLNPWIDRHQIWNTWFHRGYLPPQKIRGQSAEGGFAAHTWNIQNIKGALLCFSFWLRVL